MKKFKTCIAEGAFLKGHPLRSFWFVLWCIGLVSGICLPLKGQSLKTLPDNPHYFQYQNKPLLIIGSGEHYGALVNAAFDFNAYFKTLSYAGLNHTRLFMGAYYEKPGAFGIKKNTLAPSPGNLVLPWKSQGEKYDLTSWNDAYFSRLHQFMNLSAAAGVIVEITLFSSYYGAGWNYHPFHSSQNINNLSESFDFRKAHTLENGRLLQFQELYVKKMVRELNPYDHFYFEIQNEPWADLRDTLIVWNQTFKREDLKSPGNFWKNTIEVPAQASYQWHQAVSAWIVEEEKKLNKKHLISHNIANFKFPVSVNNPDISIYNFHYALPEAVDLNYKLNKIIGFNETGFIGQQDYLYRRQAWRFIMAGGGLFSHLDYSFSSDHPDGTEDIEDSPGGGSPGLRTQLSLLKKLISAHDLNTLKPDHSFIQHIEGAFYWSMQDKSSYLVYFEPVSTHSFKIALNIVPGRYRIDWINCDTGQVLKSTPAEKLNNKVNLDSPEGMSDVFLRLTRL